MTEHAENAATSAQDELAAELVAAYEAATGRQWPTSRVERIALAGGAGVDFAKAATMGDGEIAFAVLAKIEAADLALTIEARESDAWYPATWYCEATRGVLNADRLRAAGNAGRIESAKHGGRHRYRLASVCAQWPECRDMIEAAQSNAKRKKPERSGNRPQGSAKAA